MINYYELVTNNPDYFKQFSSKDLLFLNYDCPVKENKVSKWSEHSYIYYVLSGRKTLHSVDHSLTLVQGSIAFVKKGAIIIEQFFEEPFCIVAFIIPDSWFRCFLKDYAPNEKGEARKTAPIIPIFDNAMIRGFYQSILPYFAATDPVPEEIIELKFRELLLYILHHPDNRELHHYFLELREQAATHIEKIMETNFPYNLGIEAYARLSNRSVSTFKRDFQTIYKTTPGRWLTEKKLEQAKKLLVRTTHSIADVAFESGFENTAHFSRLFKQKTGSTPLEYRKRSRERFLLAV